MPTNKWTGKFGWKESIPVELDKLVRDLVRDRHVDEICMLITELSAFSHLRAEYLEHSETFPTMTETPRLSIDRDHWITHITRKKRLFDALSRTLTIAVKFRTDIHRHGWLLSAMLRHVIVLACYYFMAKWWGGRALFSLHYDSTSLHLLRQFATFELFLSRVHNQTKRR